MQKYSLFKFFIKNTLALTLLILIPDVVFTLYLITQKVAEHNSDAFSALSLIMLLIKCIALEFAIRSLIKDYKEKMIFTIFKPYINLIFIPVCLSYYYIILSGLFVDKFYESLIGIISVLILGLQVIVIVKRLGTYNIYKDRFQSLKNVKQLIHFDGYVEISIDMKLESLNFRLGDFKVDEEQLYYKKHIFNYERFTHYIKEFNINITKMTDDDFMIAKMYCI